MTVSPPQPTDSRAPAPVDEAQLAEDLADRLTQARPVLVLSPPRGASTAFARALQQHSKIQRYFHEPYGRYSYEGASLASVLDELEGLEPGALIKEMTFQLRDLETAEALFRHVASPVIFLARSPLLTVESRIRLVLTDLIQAPDTAEADRQAAEAAIAAKDYAPVDGLLSEELFPLFRTGWSDFATQFDLCRRLGLDYAVVETSEFRRQPEAILTRLCSRLGWEFESGMLSWEPRSALPPGALNRHANWYARVGQSTGVQPPTEELLELNRFPARFQAHLPKALATYEEAVQDAHCLSHAASASA